MSPDDPSNHAGPSALVRPVGWFLVVLLAAGCSASSHDTTDPEETSLASPSTTGPTLPLVTDAPFFPSPRAESSLAGLPDWRACGSDAAAWGCWTSALDAYRLRLAEVFAARRERMVEDAGGSGAERSLAEEADAAFEDAEHDWPGFVNDFCSGTWGGMPGNERGRWMADCELRLTEDAIVIVAESFT